MRTRRSILATLVVCGLLGAVAPARADLLRPHDGRRVGLAWARPQVDDEPTNFPSGAWILQAAFPLDGGTIVDVTLPAGHWIDDRDSDLGFGNARIRFTTRALDGEARFDFGLTLPTASTTSAAGVVQGLRTVLVDDAERFTPELAALTAGIERSFALGNAPVAFRPRLEGSFWIRTADDRVGDDVEFFVRPSLGLIATGGPATFLAEFRARYWATAGTFVVVEDGELRERDPSFDEVTVQDLRLEVEFDAGDWRPALHVAISLDEDLDGLAERVFGLRLTRLLD